MLPSDEAAARGDLVLAVLVALTALGIAPSEPWELRSRWKTVLALSLLPFAMLVPLAWTLSLLFESPVREGVLTPELSSTEVAAVGLVALAGGDAALALGALAENWCRFCASWRTAATRAAPRRSSRERVTDRDSRMPRPRQLRSPGRLAWRSSLEAARRTPHGSITSMSANSDSDAS